VSGDDINVKCGYCDIWCRYSVFGDYEFWSWYYSFGDYDVWFRITLCSLDGSKITLVTLFVSMLYICKVSPFFSCIKSNWFLYPTHIWLFPLLPSISVINKIKIHNLRRQSTDIRCHNICAKKTWVRTSSPKE
jgi:hypothetical protein